MKKSGKYEHKHSPLSSSEYLIDRKKGDIYRKADHWDRCASCYWGTKFNGGYAIGKSNVKDFKRNDNGYFYNNEKTKSAITSARKVLSILKKMITIPNVVYDEKAIKAEILQTKNIIEYSHIEEKTKKQIERTYKIVFDF